MHTQCRTYQISRAIATEGHATDDVVTVLVGITIDRELLLCRYDLGDEGGTLDVCVVAVGNTISLTVVIDITHPIDTLIHGPVSEQVFLGAGKGAVVVGIHLLISEHLGPYAYLVNKAFEPTLTKGYGA